MILPSLLSWRIHILQLITGQKGNECSSTWSRRNKYKYELSYFWIHSIIGDWMKRCYLWWYHTQKGHINKRQTNNSIKGIVLGCQNHREPRFELYICMSISIIFQSLSTWFRKRKIRPSGEKSNLFEIGKCRKTRNKVSRWYDIFNL